MKFIFGLFVVAFIVGGVALYGLFGGPGQPEQLISEDERSGLAAPSPDSSEPVKYIGEGSLSSLKKLSSTLECQILYDDPELLEPVTGTYFISGDQVRGDFIMNVPELGGTVVSSIIFNNQLLYAWADIGGQKYGVKVATETNDSASNELVRSPVPPDERISYDCREWETVDGSIFEPPSTVLFQDGLNTLEAGMEYGTIYEEGEF